MRAAVGADFGLERNATWIQVDRAVGDRFGGDTFAEQSRFNKYAKAAIHPNRTTLRLVDKHYPGTLAVYERGPGLSHLWLALGPHPAGAISAIEQEWRSGVVVRDTRDSGAKVEYRVVPRAIATHYKLSAKGGFPIIDARKLLQPWQRVDECLGQWVSMSSPMPGRRTLSIGPEPERSRYRARLNVSNARNAVALPWLVSLSYDIAFARCFDQPLRVDASLLAPHGIAVEELRTLLAEAERA